MSATTSERIEARANRDRQDTHARQLGHTLHWRLAPNATRHGHAYYYEGRCDDCAAEVTAGASWSSCPAVRDARHEPCSGPGTAVLTDIETTRCAELVAAAVARYGQQISEGR